MRADSFQPVRPSKPRVTVAPLEEVRRARRANTQRKDTPTSPPRIAASGTGASPIVVARPQPILPWVLAGVFFSMACGVSAAWWLAAAATTGSKNPPVSAAPNAPPSEGILLITRPQQEAIEHALSDLRGGMAAHALSSLRGVREENPRIPSLDYLLGLAALQAGEIEEAKEAIAMSLAKGERVSDALALRASLEAQAEGGAGWTPIGDVIPAAERSLHEAITADPANPFPYFELAMRWRMRGDNARAKEMLKSARLRLQPNDAHAAVDVTLRLLELQEMEDGALPQLSEEPSAPADLFAAAYLGLRVGEDEQAAAFLQKARASLPPELYKYLIADPAFAPYRTRPGLAEEF